MKIEFANLDWHLEREYLGSEPTWDDPIWKCFTNFLKPDDAPQYGAYDGPRDAARAAMFWSLLRYHWDKNFTEIHRILRLTVERGLLLHQETPKDARDEFDMMMIESAVLSGDPILMRKAASDVWYSSNELTRLLKYRVKPDYHLFPSFCGVLRGRILNDKRLELDQFERFSATPKMKTHPLPGIKLLTAFVNREYSVFNRQLVKDIKKYIDGACKVGFHTELTQSSVTVDLKAWRSNWLWPWPEAVLAKLVILDGGEITYDNGWLPSGYLHSFVL